MIQIDWEQNSHAVLTQNSTGRGEYDDRIAIASFALSGEEFEYTFSVAESENNTSAASLNEYPVQKDAIFTEKFPELEFAFERGLNYGTWYISSLHPDSNQMYLLFRPNSTAINSLTATDTITSELTIIMHERINGDLVEKARNLISISIVGSPFEIQSRWNSGFDGVLKINKANLSYNDISTILYYNHTDIDLEFSKVNETTISGNQETTVSSSSVVSANVNLGQFESADIQQFGNILEFGTWYIVNSYNCEGQFQCKLLVFRPDTSAINSLVGSDVVETMEVSYTDSDGSSEVLDISFRIESPDTEVSISNLQCDTSEPGCTSSSLEGEELEFEVTRSNNNISEPLSVAIEIKETGNMLANSGLRRVTIAENSLSEVVTIDVIQDSIYNADSEVTVTLIYSEDYSVNESQKTFTNIVNDDDLSIQMSRLESGVSQIVEGEQAEFKIVSISGPVQKDIKVNFNIVEDGPATNNLDFVGGYTDGEFPTNIVMPRGQEEITVTLETIDDSSFRGIGRVKLHLLENPNQYVIHEPNNYSTNFVDILENEPNFSITTVNESIIEGNDLIYMITVDRGLQNAQTVSVELTGDTSFNNGAISQAVEFYYPATRVKYLNFKTFDNAIHNEFGTVVATIAENSKLWFNYFKCVNSNLR